MNFTFVPVELCKTDDKQVHYFVTCAERNGMHVVKVKNKFFALIINEYTWRSPTAKFQKVKSGIYQFK